MPTPAQLEARLADLERRLAALSGPMLSRQAGATSLRPWQVGLPVELTGAYDSTTGYPWKALVLDPSLASGQVKSDAALPTGKFAYTPDNDTSLTSTTRGWLEPDPQARGFLFVKGGSSSPPTTASSPIKARVAATGNVTVSNPATNIFDGVGATSGDVLFLAFQTAGAENGPYVFNGPFSALTRHTDADSSAELLNCEVVVSEGTKNADTKWLCTANAPITVGTTALTWRRTSPERGVAKVTTTDTGAGHTVTEYTWGGGTSAGLGPGSPTVTYSPCYSTTGTALPVNTVVNVGPHPLISGAYAITPAGDAASGLPGLLNTTTQTVSGLKSFVTGVQVGPTSNTVGMYPDAGTIALPTSYFTGGSFSGPQSGNYIQLAYAANSDASRIFQGAPVSVGADSVRPLWVLTDIGNAGGICHGLFILVGTHAVYDTASASVLAGATGTLLANPVATNGIVTSVGAKLTSITSLTDSTGGTAGNLLSAVSGSGADAAINNNLASLASTVNTILARLRSGNIIS